MNNWVVLANSEQAKVYNVINSNGQYNNQLIENLSHINGKLKTEGVTEDLTNVNGNSGNSVTRHNAPKEIDSAKFANVLAEYLNKNSNNIGNLSIVAESHFLGLLLKDLDNKVRETIVKKISKDYIHSLQVGELTIDKIMELIEK